MANEKLPDNKYHHNEILESLIGKVSNLHNGYLRITETIQAK